MRSWYFPFEGKRDADRIDALWTVFAEGVRFADSDDSASQDAFAAAFDDVNRRPQAGGNLTFGLYWISPWFYLSLDRNSYDNITSKLRVPVGRHGPKRRCNAADYLALMDALEPRLRKGHTRFTRILNCRWRRGYTRIQQRNR